MKVEQTTFITFYSFKGGVGRTMALVNTAYLLYKSGRKVLIVDADLEAPGLWSVTSLDYDRQHPGFVELVKEYKERCDSSDYSKDQKVPDPSDYIAPVEFKIKPAKKKSEGYAPGGEIAIMPAGIKEEEYVNKLHSIDFEELFKEYYGSLFFQEIRERIRKSEHYDYVLIDSRTGFSDSGDICTHELCDHLIVLTGLNNQNLEGTKRFLDKWKEINNSIKNTKEFVLVASPIPFGEEELKSKRLKEAKKILGEEINLQISYHPRLSLIEEPFVFNWPDSYISQSYHKISRRVRKWGHDNVGAWVEKFDDLFREKKYDEALDCIKEWLIMDRRNAITKLKTLTSQVVPSNEIFLKSSLRYFELLNHSEPNNEITLTNWGNALGRLGVIKGNSDLIREAIKKHQRAIELESNDYIPYINWSISLINLWKAEKKLQYLKEAIQKSQIAVELEPNAYVVYNVWGSALIHLGIIENEKKYYKQALEILKKGEKVNSEELAFNLACAYSLLNESDSALSYLRKAIEYDPKDRQIALEEEDFAPLRDNPEFIALVSPPEKNEE